ncbi:MAG: hypothetical protein IJN81_08595 [Clostridia bacterium]|nr:hypothetical protein [Clostridia bacterium]
MSKKAKIIVLAGQSNAVGVGHVQYLPKHFDQSTIDRFTNGFDNILINFNSHDIKSNGFVKTTVGCTERSKRTLGPEVGVAQTLSEKYPDEKFYIVKCAFGGTNHYSDWLTPSGGEAYGKASHNNEENHNENYRTAGWCWNELTAITDESLSFFVNSGFDPEIIAFCWMQGESDADKEHCTGYGARYKALLSDFSARYGKYYNNCVFVDAGISEIWQEYKAINEIKESHAKQTENSFYIDTIGSGLTTLNEPEEEPDIAHYDCDCTVKLGNLFAEKINL